MPVAASGPEAIAFYSTESGGVSTIHQQIISESANGPNGSLTVGAPTTLEANLSGGVTSLFDGFTNIKSDLSTSSSLTSYDIAWATYNTSTHTYQAQFQIFPTGGNPAAVATLIAPVTLASPALAPAWEFRNAGSLSDHGVSVPYASVIAVADGTHVGQHDIQFQGYNVDGSANPDVHFQIAPDLSAFQPGATNQITQPTNGTSLMFTPNGVAGSGFSVAWSETVTDSAGTHNQVEFAIFKASGFNATGTFGSGQLLSQTTFQVPDAQNIRVGSITLGGASFEFLAYGDGTSTTVIEFDQTGHQVASITDTAHNGVTFSDLAVLGDGRIALSYADGAAIAIHHRRFRPAPVRAEQPGALESRTEITSPAPISRTASPAATAPTISTRSSARPAERRPIRSLAAPATASTRRCSRTHDRTSRFRSTASPPPS